MYADPQVRAASSCNMTIVLSLQSLADRLELQFEDRFASPPKGVYLNTKLEPVMRDGNSYYEHLPNGERVKVVDINKATTAIYTEKDERIITAAQIKNKEKTLSNVPIAPYFGLKIARLLFEHAIDSRIRWRKYSSKVYDKISLLFKNLPAEDVQVLLHDYQEEVNELVAPLIDHHDWHYFYLRDRGLYTLEFERGEDYRIAWFNAELEAGRIRL